MRILDGLQKRIPAALNQFVLDGFGYESASIPFELVDLFDEIGWQSDRDTLHWRHAKSMTHSVIILNRVPEEQPDV
jgi:hypothetical protein